MSESRRERTNRARTIAQVIRRTSRTFRPTVVGAIAGNTHDPFQVLLAAVLSARTRDRVTATAAERLFHRAPTPERLLLLSEREVSRLIYPVGMYPTKARWIRTIARDLLERYGGRVPQTREALMQFPGVGRKVANLVLGVCFATPAVCVDVHVHRISNRLGLVRTRTPEASERALEEVLPRSLWIPWNDLLVLWGQNVCLPTRPRCSHCPLFARHLCPRVGVVISG